MIQHLRLVAPLGLAATLGLAILGGPALAHHSFAMFDSSRPTKITGTVHKFDWTNPHATLWIYADPKPGAAAELWNFETTSPGNLLRFGWTKRSFQAGDKVQVEFAPLRSGEHAGQLIEVIAPASGRVLNTKKAPSSPK
ncbi:MAG TPA: DUF6152 family protein [Phenylobacterium sp.]|nr:DUF6152 family protein [Phenylobacterium sp.]